MKGLLRLLSDIAPVSILDSKIPISDFCPIDLSMGNPELKTIDISDAEVCQEYIDKVLHRHKAMVTYGGYMEKRGLYTNSERFASGQVRNIHLGVDFWCKAETAVLTPIDGTLHSFANNSDFGNYGPTIVLEHLVGGYRFYTLYGHLSLESLDGLREGKRFEKGTVLGTLGTPDINVGYAPHLHFQMILDIGEYQGDYPGVCSQTDMDYYKNNCPNPNLLFGLPL